VRGRTVAGIAHKLGAGDRRPNDSTLAVQGLIADLPREQRRLLLMLWHLAER